MQGQQSPFSLISRIKPHVVAHTPCTIVRALQHDSGERPPFSVIPEIGHPTSLVGACRGKVGYHTPIPGPLRRHQSRVCLEPLRTQRCAAMKGCHDRFATLDCDTWLCALGGPIGLLDSAPQRASICPGCPFRCFMPLLSLFFLQRMRWQEGRGVQGWIIRQPSPPPPLLGPKTVADNHRRNPPPLGPPPPPPPLLMRRAGGGGTLFATGPTSYGFL